MGLSDLFSRPLAPEPSTPLSLSTLIERAPLAFLDVETTGLNAWSGDRVCEVAIVLCLGRRETDRLATLVNPMRHIPADAQAVNHISDAMVAGAPPFAEVAATVADLLSGAIVVAHNTPFDLSFIRREFTLVGRPAPLGPRSTRSSSRDGRALASATALARSPVACASECRAIVRLADVLTTREVFWRLIEPHLGPGSTVGDAMRLHGWGEPSVDSAGDDARSTHLVSEAHPVAEALVSALRAGERLRMVYRAVDGRATERTIDPMTVVDQGDELVVVAYCHLRRAERTFTLRRIVSWGLTATEQPSARLADGD